MNSSRIAGRQALANFFSGFIPQPAHWYSIILPMKDGCTDDRIAHAFPPLCKLASLKEEMMQALLLHCGLVQFRRNSGHSVLEQEWFNMKVEYQLMEFEVTHFTINKKKRYYIRLGTWNSVSHKQRTPGEIWSALSSGSLRLPRTSTSLLSSTLAKAIGSLDVILPFMKHSSTSSDCESVSSSEVEIDDGSDSEDNEKSTDSSSVVALSADLPDASKFPLLHSLFQLIQDVMFTTDF
jgi:hypothetical protein